MATPQRGFGAYAGLGEETVYGTPVTITNWLRELARKLRLVSGQHGLGLSVVGPNG